MIEFVESSLNNGFSYTCCGKSYETGCISNFSRGYGALLRKPEKLSFGSERAIGDYGLLLFFGLLLFSDPLFELTTGLLVAATFLAKLFIGGLSPFFFF